MRSIDGFGELVRRAREQLGLTQAEAAALMGYDQRTLSRIERGQCYPNAATLQDIADTMDVTFVIEPRDRT